MSVITSQCVSKSDFTIPKDDNSSSELHLVWCAGQVGLKIAADDWNLLVNFGQRLEILVPNDRPQAGMFQAL